VDHGGKISYNTLCEDGLASFLSLSLDLDQSSVNFGFVPANDADIETLPRHLHAYF